MSRRAAGADRDADGALSGSALGFDPGAVGGAGALWLVHAGGNSPGRRGDAGDAGLPGVGGELLRPPEHEAGRPPPDRGLHQHLLLDARRRPAARRRPGRRRGRRGLLRHRLRVPRRLRHRPDGLDRPALLRPAGSGRGRDRDRAAASRGRCPAAEGPGQARAGGGRLMAHRLEKRVLLEHAEDPELRTLDGYRRLAGGYETLERAYKEMEQDEVLKELEDSGLRGRGGAGFAMGKKASFLPRGDMAKYLCCNADESEPGAFKDRELMQRNPHQLIEGIAIAALAADAGHAFIFIRGEYDEQADILDAAVAEAYEAGYLGTNILGCHRDLELVVHRGAGAYICGEETALLDALEGKRGNPRLKPPFPAVQGLYGGPTLTNNVETPSNVPRIVAQGAAG